MRFELRALGNGVFRVRAWAEKGFGESLLSRYGLIHEPPAAAVSDTAVSDGGLTLAADGDTLTLTGGRHPLTLTAAGPDGAPYCHHGFALTLPIRPHERFFGLGDETRECIQKRGHTADMWIENVTSYGPMPFLVSSDGWAIFTNLTFRHSFDIGDSDPNLLQIRAADGALDLYLFACGSMKACIGAYTALTGRPPVLPKFAYGYLYVENEQTDARSLLWDCRTFRKEGIPCDTLGLEPSWMSKHYDYSVDKAWNKDLFYLPHWLPDNQSGTFTFFYALRQMGFHFSLWLCIDYDLLYKEEADLGGRQKAGETYALPEGAAIGDEHFTSHISMDQITKPGEAWFEHLKKFVDNGAAAFKLDGSNQVIPHPDRLWAGHYRDAEVHNVYPVLYARQMAEGFEDYTGRRAMIYTAGMYAGTQGYAATWAGDTGGGPKSLVSILNFAMAGHANTTCDMQVTDISGIHCGFLLPWAQQLGWANWQYPWFLSEPLEEAIRFYSNLRLTLFPTLYAAAYAAWETGLPIARPLSLVYEDSDRFDGAKNLYMLGDSLLVAAFEMRFPLPEGTWIDFWNEDEYEGGGMLDYTPPADRGGALLVKAGAIFARMAPQPSVMHHIPETICLDWYPREGAEGRFALYEDDGETLDYRDGTFARTEVRGATQDGVSTLTVTPRENHGVADEYLSRKLALRIHAPGKRTLRDAAGAALPAEVRDGALCAELPFGFAGGTVTLG